MNLPYKSAGVDLEKAALIKTKIGAIAKQTFANKNVSPIGGFGGVIESSKNSDTLLVSSTDGVGTKVRIHAALKRYELSGIDIVNHCVNDILPTGASPLFFLDYLGMSNYNEEVTLGVLRGMSKACIEAGCALVGGETASMPGFYSKGDYDVVGFIVGTVNKKELLNPQQTVENGDVLVGLSSSGLHTNGYSLVRKLFRIDEDSSVLSSTVLGAKKSFGELLATPHKSYLKELKPVMGQIKGMSHITGGGVEKNIPRVLRDDLYAVIDLSSWKVPPIFSHIQSKGSIPLEEMFEVFNMGLGMVVIVSKEKTNAILDQIEGSWVVGRITKENPQSGTNKRVVLSGLA